MIPNKASKSNNLSGLKAMVIMAGRLLMIMIKNRRDITINNMTLVSLFIKGPKTTTISIPPIQDTKLIDDMDYLFD